MLAAMEPPPPPRRSAFETFLIPDLPRHFPGQRWLKIVLRALHVLGAGVYAGAHVFDVPAASRTPWFWAALLSGLLVLAVDLFESGAFLVQVRGLVVMLKLGLLAAVPSLGAAAPCVLGLIVVGSVFSSHAPSSFRYHLLWGRGRIRGAETKG